MHSDDELGPLTHDRLTRELWLYQRARGHRFSSDDLVTAMIAADAAPHAQRVLDLGCGIGTVLLHLAWSLPTTTLVGVEAQSLSFALLTRNVESNGLASRIQVHHGDLRDESIQGALGTGYSLVTGTPPYFPLSTAVDAMDEQRAYARIEYRGGVEAYLAAGARALAHDGVMVMCGAGGENARVEHGAAAAGLSVVARCDVHGRAGELPLFAVWTLRHQPQPLVLTSLTLRDIDGNKTPDAARVKAFSGLS